MFIKITVYLILFIFRVTSSVFATTQIRTSGFDPPQPMIGCFGKPGIRESSAVGIVTIHSVTFTRMRTFEPLLRVSIELHLWPLSLSLSLWPRDFLDDFGVK